MKEHLGQTNNAPHNDSSLEDEKFGTIFCKYIFTFQI